MRPTWLLALALIACGKGTDEDSGPTGTTATNGTGPGTGGGTGAGTGGGTGGGPTTGTGTATGTGTGTGMGTGTGTGTGTGGTTNSNCTAVATGADERVRVPRFAGQDLVGTDFTIEAWIWVDPSNGAFSNLPVAYSDPRDDVSGWRLVVGGGSGNRTLRFQLGAGVPQLPTIESSSGTIPESTWTHVAVTHGSGPGTTSLFIDGIPAVTDTFASGPSSGTSSGDLTLGGTDTGGPYDFIGGLDEVRISTVQRYYATFTPAYDHTVDGDTLGLWHFDEGTGTVAADASGTQDGTLEGVGWAAGSPCGGAP